MPVSRFVAAVAVITIAAGSPLVAQQSAPARGAVIGGVSGAGLAGLAGALISIGICDAADCSDAWIDGVVPGAVLGGFGGALLGAGLGAALGSDRPGDGRPGHRWRPAALVDFSVARTESESVDRGTTGGRLLIGARRGGLLVGPSYEHQSGSDATVTSATMVVRLERSGALVRPFAEVGTGRFSWRYEGIIATCQPGSPPNCSYAPGTVRDAYLGVAGGVGIAIGDPDGRWSLHAQLRYHHSGSRETGELLSTTTRQLRQLTIGGSVTLGDPAR